MSDEVSIIRPGSNGAGKAIEVVAGFGTQSVKESRETQGSALAERAKADVQARYIMAMQNNRDVDNFRVLLLKSCKRKTFAEIAEYNLKIGGNQVKGATVRFVESALQLYKNVQQEFIVTYDDAERRITRVSVTDIENNITYSEDSIVEKFVERKFVKDTDQVISSRLNSSGDLVYRIVANEADFANKAAAGNSKKLRNLGLRILPGDIIREALDNCRQVRAQGDKEDPTAARRRVLDLFAELNVMPSDLVEYLGHSTDLCSPAELDELRMAYAAVRDGEATWVSLLEAKRAERGEIESTSKLGEKAGDIIKAKLDKAKADKAKKQAAQTAPVETPTQSDEQKQP